MKRACDVPSLILYTGAKKTAACGVRTIKNRLTFMIQDFRSDLQMKPVELRNHLISCRFQHLLKNMKQKTIWKYAIWFSNRTIWSGRPTSRMGLESPRIYANHQMTAESNPRCVWQGLSGISSTASSWGKRIPIQLQLELAALIRDPVMRKRIGNLKGKRGQAC